MEDEYGEMKEGDEWEHRGIEGKEQEEDKGKSVGSRKKSSSGHCQLVKQR